MFYTLEISEDSPKEFILGQIEKNIADNQAKYIVVSFHSNLMDLQRKDIVQTIKKHFDIFVILRADLPKQKEIVEEYFCYGVHGLYFDSEINLHSLEQVEILTFATETFARGWVFARAVSEETMIKELLRLRLVPVITDHDESFVNFIKSHEYFSKISSNLIKVVPLLDTEQADFSLTDKIKMKMLLESMNLRHKLMVKSVDESFGSSGL